MGLESSTKEPEKEYLWEQSVYIKVGKTKPVPNEGANAPELDYEIGLAENGDLILVDPEGPQQRRLKIKDAIPNLRAGFTPFHLSRSTFSKTPGNGALWTEPFIAIYPEEEKDCIQLVSVRVEEATRAEAKNRSEQKVREGNQGINERVQASLLRGDTTVPLILPQELAVDRQKHNTVAVLCSISDAPAMLHYQRESPHGRRLGSMQGFIDCMFRQEVEAGAMVVWRNGDKMEILCPHFVWKREDRDPRVSVYSSQDLEEASELAWDIAGGGNDAVVEPLLEHLLIDDGDGLLKIPFDNFGDIRDLGYLLKLAFSSGALRDAPSSKDEPVLSLCVTRQPWRKNLLPDIQRSLPGKRKLLVVAEREAANSVKEDYKDSGLVQMLLRTALTNEDWNDKQRALLQTALATLSLSTLIKERLCPDLMRLVLLASGNEKYRDRLDGWLQNQSLKKAWDLITTAPRKI